MISNSITNGINGYANIPGDKSISHRSIIIPSISNGVSEINNILKSEDVLHTLNAFKAMGVSVEENNNKLIIFGKGLNSLKKPEGKIYLGNSGTSARLLTGLLSSQKFDTILTGDKSLSNRPMRRISDPLSKMNARINSSNGKLPLKIEGSEYDMDSIPEPVKQLIAGINAADAQTKMYQDTLKLIAIGKSKLVAELKKCLEDIDPIDSN